MYALSIKRFCLIALFYCPFLLFAQDFNNYQPLVSEAPIPEEFILSSTQKYERDKQTINRQDKRSKRKAQEEFYLENNFVLDEMLLSGSVLFNDPVSKYIGKVADELLKNDQELRSKLRFYTIKSPIPNAFATDRGTIFITLGLMARLNNEAELAYILSHEIVHVAKKHSLNTYVKFETDQSSVWNQQPYYKKLVEKNNYSKELEIEADNLGLDYFDNSKYSYKAIAKVFDVLALAHTPYGNIPFEKEYLETKHFKITDDYLLKSVNPIEKMDDDDEGSTHPALSQRKDKLQVKIAKKSDQGRSVYLVSKAAFMKVKTIAKFDICQTLLHERWYQDAIYYSFLLSKEYPNNDFLQRTLVYSLYGLAQYKNTDRSNEVEYDSDEVQGESQQIYHITDELSGKDLSVLAALHCWEYYKKHPDNEMFKKIAMDMIEDLVIYQVEDPQDYFASNAENRDTSISDLSFYAFADWMKDEELLKVFEEGKKYKEKFDKRDKFYDTEEGIESWEDYQEDIRINGKKLGLDKVVFVNPIYLKIKGSYQQTLQLVESEEKQKLLTDMIAEGGKAVDLKTEILNIKDLSASTSIEDYQDIITINNWMKESLAHDMEMISSNYHLLLPLTEKYGTTSFAYTGVMTLQGKRNWISSGGFYVGVLLLLPPFTPVGVDYIFSRPTQSYYFTLVFDAKISRSILEFSNRMVAKEKPGLIKVNLNWCLQQMKNKRK